MFDKLKSVEDHFLRFDVRNCRLLKFVAFAGSNFTFDNCYVDCCGDGYNLGWKKLKLTCIHGGIMINFGYDQMMT